MKGKWDMCSLEMTYGPSVILPGSWVYVAWLRDILVMFVGKKVITEVLWGRADWSMCVVIAGATARVVSEYMVLNWVVSRFLHTLGEPESKWKGNVGHSFFNWGTTGGGSRWWQVAELWCGSPCHHQFWNRYVIIHNHLACQGHMAGQNSMQIANNDKQQHTHMTPCFWFTQHIDKHCHPNP